jgi:hypothetical protein
MPLSLPAHNLLRELANRIDQGNIVAGQPQTYPRYGQLHDALHLEMQGETYGQSLKRQGLEELAIWVHEHHYPAITGLIVNDENHSPDSAYFREYGRDEFAFDWWRQQVADSIAFNWRQFLLAQDEPAGVAARPIPTNVASRNREELEQRNYVRKADPGVRYWFGFDAGPLEEYKRQFGDDFGLILIGALDVEGDYYHIPFAAIKHMLTDEYATEHEGGRRRWLGDIREHRLRISTCPVKLDVGQYYGIPFTSPESETSEAVQNDYAIENRKAEIQQRVKQSVFRDRVLKNFGSRCCVSGISETDLLVGSHIVPWSVRIESRLDPANGLCLFCVYDALFDAGYFTLSDDLRIITTTRSLSPELTAMLTAISGRRISSPTIRIKSEYLAYHRDTIFKT